MAYSEQQEVEQREVKRQEIAPALAQLAAELEVRAPHVEAPALAANQVQDKELALAK